MRSPRSRSPRPAADIRPPRAPGRRDAGGFTLVELVTVVAIVGIVATVGAVRFASPSPFAGRAASDALAASLRHAQRMAVAQRTPLHVVVGDVPASLAICRDAACTLPVASPDDEPWFRPRGVAGLSAAGTFSFDGMGRPSVTTAWSTRPVGDDGRPIGPSVQVEAETGLVRVLP
jgi:MSHA pilin protein MshC